MHTFPTVISTLKSHQLVIFGLGREGLSSYQLIRRYLPDQPVTLVDDLPLEKLNPEWQAYVNQDQALQFYQTNTIPELSSDSLVIKTPGIPLNHPFALSLREQQIPVTSNMQLFFNALHDLGKNRDIVTIGVTGTKGKSTTTAVIHHVLQSAGLQTWLGGNIGVPALDLLRNIDEVDIQQKLFVVLELSCHQLDELHTSPNIAVIQNIVPEHLDYYGSFERYVEAKSHITRFQTPIDEVIFNAEFSVPTELAQLSPGRKVSFSVAAFHEALLAADLPLVGEHNLENMIPAVIIGEELGLERTTIFAALKSFEPLPHRLQWVGEMNGISYYNDSLSTVPEATIAALRAFPDKNVVLLAGGFDRGQDFGELAQFILKTKVKALVLFPPTGEHIAAEIRQQGGHSLPMFFVTTMPQAMEKAAALAKTGDVVLLSPASASFGHFKDYADRGDQFRYWVQKAVESQDLDHT